VVYFRQVFEALAMMLKKQAQKRSASSFLAIQQIMNNFGPGFNTT
jgi:hypothetical protein